MSTKESLHVLDPMGYPPVIEQLTLAPRLTTLSGKSVYLVDCRFDDGDLLMQQMQNWFQEHMPEVRTVLRSKAGIYSDRDPELYEEIRANADAAIVAVGH